MALKIGAAIAAAGLLAGAVLALGARNAAAPVPQLHSVWCVQAGYPQDLAMPQVVGPGTGLAGCPAGERQVSGP